MLLKEWRGSAPWYPAIFFPFRTGVVPAKATEVSVGAGFEEKDFYLMVCNPDIGLFQQLIQAPNHGESKGVEVVECRCPDREIQVFYFVPDFNPIPFVGLKTRNFLVEVFRN